MTLWLVWAVEIPHGYSQALRYLASTIVVLAAARLVQIIVLGALDRMLRVKPDTASRYPGIETRLAIYYPVVVSATRALIFLASAIILLQIWGLGALAWLVATPLGQRVLSTFVTLAVTLLLALTAWEAVNAAIERHLARLTREAQVARSARLRTLLPRSTSAPMALARSRSAASSTRRDRPKAGDEAANVPCREARADRGSARRCFG